MTEKEAIKTLEYTRRIRGLLEQGERWEANGETIAIDMAIKALKGIEKYKVIGTVEEIKEIFKIISEGQDDVDESGISTGLLHTLLEYAEYAKIGTVEECREARERQMAKKPLIKLKNKTKIQTGDYVYIKCPCCGENIFSCFYYMPWNDSQKSHKHCQNCGQAIDFSEA